MPKNRKNRKPKASPQEAQPSSSRSPRGNSGDRPRDDRPRDDHPSSHQPAAGSSSSPKHSSGDRHTRGNNSNNSSAEKGRDKRHSSGEKSHHSPTKDQASSSNHPPPKDVASSSHHSPTKDIPSTSTAGNITTLMGKVNISAPAQVYRPISRPGFGTVGTPVTLETNYFKLRFSPKLIISQYSVSVWLRRHPDHADPTKRRNRAKAQASRDHYDWIDVSHVEPVSYLRNVFNLVFSKYASDFGCMLAYDGRSIAYAPRHIKDNALNTSFKVTVGKEGDRPTDRENRDGTAEEVRVKVAFAKDLRASEILDPAKETLSSVEYLAAFDNALANSPRKKYIQIGRSFFSPNGARPLSRDFPVCSAWSGFYQSARLTQLGPLVNLDQSFTAFWNRGGRPLMDLLRDLNRRRDVTDRDVSLFHNAGYRLRNMKIRASHNGMTYKFCGFTNESADKRKFKTDKGEICVSEYFANSYNIRLRFGNLPCVKAHPARDIYLPLELCIILENQRMLGLLSPEETSAMVKTASMRPREKREAAISAMKALNHNNDPLCKDFGITVETEPVKVRARFLPPPKMLYGDERSVSVSSGSWRPDRKYFAPAKLLTWVMISEGRNDEDEEFVIFFKAFVRAAEKMGMRVARPRVVHAEENKIVDAMKSMSDLYKAHKHLWNGGFSLQLMVILKNRSDTRSYNEIKRSGDTEFGVASQVCLAKHIRGSRNFAMYMDNVMLKVNAKLGGQSFVASPYNGMQGIPDIPFLRYPHMVLGADVTHPMPGSQSPSVAALVASRDRETMQFSAALRNQTSRQEVIEDLGAMFKEVYQSWMNNFGNKYHAYTVVMFRDGVSEGQFEEVMTKEVRSIRQACLEIAAGCRPRITYIIVTKRHHTRFFGEGTKFLDRSGNVMPGLVVDRDVTSNEYYDFYVNSHAGIQGTSKPSKYTVLIDENKIPVDVLQAYVFRLAHSFSRCNRSVSMVNSAYYAHLLAFRGRSYLGEELLGTKSTASQEKIVKAPRMPNYISRRLFFV